MAHPDFFQGGWLPTLPPRGSAGAHAIVTLFTGSTPGIERVQALADISRSHCCHGNATRAPIAKPPNIRATKGHALSYHSPKLHPGACSSVGMRPRTDTQRDKRDQYTFRVVYDSRSEITERIKIE